MNEFPAFVLWSNKGTEPFLCQISEPVLSECMSAQVTAGTQILNSSGKKLRIMRRSVGAYTALAITADPDRISSKRKLETDVDAMLSAAPIIERTLEGAESRVRRLLHNLKSLTAKMSQEIYEIALQNRMMESPRNAIPYVAGQITSEPERAARAFVEILKHLSAQRAEYTAFDRLSGKLGAAKPEVHSIHQVLMNVMYLFFGEFVRRGVRAEVGKTQAIARFDYESIVVCIYYLFENATKYVRAGSNFNVNVQQDRSALVVIRFEMESLVILRDEEEKIFQEGYSGALAKAENLHGAGLGLYLAREMARLNGGQINVLPGLQTKGASYSRNVFTLTLPAA